MRLNFLVAMLNLARSIIKDGASQQIHFSFLNGANQSPFSKTNVFGYS